MAETLKEVPAQPVDAPFVTRLTIDVASTTGSTDFSMPFATVPYAGTVLSVSYIPSGNITGEPTNNRTLSILNKGSAGSGTKVPASRVTTATLTGLQANVITVSETEAETIVAAGDILVWRSTHASSGCVDPGGSVLVRIERHLRTVPKGQPGN